jgi:glycosyltransferase involved in cell wall biosynthesis
VDATAEVPGPPFRVVYLNSSADVGGGEKWMLALADGLDRARYTTSFVVAHDGRFADEIRRRGFPLTIVDLRRLVSPRALAALVRHFRATRPHLVHTSGARASFYGRIAARLARVPAVVSSVHTSIENYEVSAPRRGVYRALDRLSSRIASRVIATSDAVAHDLVGNEGLPPDKVVTVPNRPDPRDLRPSRPESAVRTELGARAGEALVGVIARLTEQKGVGDFLDALALLRERRGWAAVVVGDGPLRGELEAHARRRSLTDRCRFAGTRTDLGDVLAALDVLVVPSRSEGLPYVVLEAMVAGTPLVATRVGGIPEALVDGRTGLLVPAATPSALADAIAALVDDPGRRRALADAAQRHAASALSLDVMLEAVDGVYRAVLAEAGLVAK